MKKLFNIIIMLFVIVASSCNNSDKKENQFAQYLKQSKIQYETDEQKHNIINALNDILTLSIEELKNKKYPNYTGEENKWDLPTLINKYFIPAHQNFTFGDNFYTNIKRKEIQEDIKDIIGLISEKRQIISAPIVYKSFIDKGGNISELKEMYIQYSIQDYYIKFCESEITKNDLENKLSNIESKIKIVELEVEFRNGAWAQCDTILDQNRSQSRIGPYVVIHRIIN